MDIITAATSIKMLKDIMDLLKNNKDPKINSKILELQESLMEINNTLFALTTENRELKEKLKVKASTKIEDGFIYILNDDGSKKSDKYCPNCYQNNNCLFKLNEDYGHGFGYQCPVCEKYFK